MIDALIKWAIIGALCAAAMATVYKAWDHYIGEPYREEGKAARQPEVDALTKQVAIAKVANEGLLRDLGVVKDAATRYAKEAAEWQDKARLAKEAAARDKAAFSAERDRLQTIINRPKSNEQCESICARANALLGDIISSLSELSP